MHYIHPMIRPMNRKILHLAIPNIISNISIPLLGIVDMALMGHLESDAYIGAIALGSLIFNFIYWGLGFLRMGTSGFTAQAWGRRDLPETILVFSRAVFIGLATGAFLLLLQKPIELFSFWILKGESQVEDLAMAYFRIRIWAAPAVLGQFALLGFFLGMQNARLPMVVLVSTNLINVACSYLFVMELDMESNGVALGTVIAQYSGLILAMYFFKKVFQAAVQVLVPPGHHPVGKAETLPADQQGYFYPDHVPGGGIFHLHGKLGQFRCAEPGGGYHPGGEFPPDAVLHVLLLPHRWFCPCLGGADRQVYRGR
jgi:Na+-driven multidrug efflux pump